MPQSFLFNLTPTNETHYNRLPPGTTLGPLRIPPKQIKFTPHEGTVTITADRLTRQDNSLGVRLAVSDTGPGIPEDMQDVIFEKFRQIDSSHTREHPGTGLGLAICKELAEMLGATVSFVSKPGQGATFFVDLPMTHQPDEPQPLMA